MSDHIKEGHGVIPARHAYRGFAPCAALREHVQCYWIRPAAGGEGRSLHRVLPDGCMDIVFQVGEPRGAGDGPVGHSGGFVVGAMTRPLLVDAGSRAEFFGVRFRPGRARLFLDMLASELTDGSAGLENFWGGEGRSLYHRLCELSSAAARVREVEKQLLRRLPRHPRADPYVEAMVERVLRSRGSAPVASLARLAGVSRQHLGNLFAAWVGVRPKLFSRVIRFQALLQQIGTAKAVDWSAAAADLGYSDQAHLIADFRALTGVTPERYRAGA